MTTVYLRNFELEHALVALSNTLKSDDNQKGVNALTMYRLNKLTKDLRKEYEDFIQLKTQLMDELVKGGSKEPEVVNGNFVYNSPEDEATFMEAMDEYVPVNVRSLLDEKDLGEFTTDSYGIQWLMLFVSGEARTEKPKTKEEEAEAVEQTTKQIEEKTKNKESE